MSLMPRRNRLLMILIKAIKQMGRRKKIFAASLFYNTNIFPAMHSPKLPLYFDVYVFSLPPGVAPIFYPLSRDT